MTKKTADSGRGCDARTTYRRLIFSVNVLFACAGVGLAAAAVWLHLGRSDRFVALPVAAKWVCGCTGVWSAAVSLLGLYGAKNRARGPLVAYLVCTVLGVMLQVALAGTVYHYLLEWQRESDRDRSVDSSSETVSSALESVERLLFSFIKSNPISWRSIQDSRAFRCCGFDIESVVNGDAASFAINTGTACALVPEIIGGGGGDSIIGRIHAVCPTACKTTSRTGSPIFKASAGCLDCYEHAEDVCRSEGPARGYLPSPCDPNNRQCCLYDDRLTAADLAAAEEDFFCKDRFLVLVRENAAFVVGVSIALCMLQLVVVFCACCLSCGVDKDHLAPEDDYLYGSQYRIGSMVESFVSMTSMYISRHGGRHRRQRDDVPVARSVALPPLPGQQQFGGASSSSRRGGPTTSRTAHMIRGVATAPPPPPQPPPPPLPPATYHSSEDAAMNEAIRRSLADHRRTHTSQSHEQRRDAALGEIYDV